MRRKGTAIGGGGQGEHHSRDSRVQTWAKVCCPDSSQRLRSPTSPLLPRRTKLNIRFQYPRWLLKKLDLSLRDFKSLLWVPPFPASKLNPSWSEKLYTSSHEKMWRKNCSVSQKLFLKILSSVIKFPFLPPKNIVLNIINWLFSLDAFLWRYHSLKEMN